MPILSTHVTLGTVAPVVIAGGDNMPQEVFIHNEDGSENTEAFIGNENVTAGNGLHLNSGVTVQMTLGPNDILWGIAGQGAPVLSILQVQKTD